MVYFSDEYNLESDPDNPYHTDEDEEFLPSSSSLSENSAESAEQSGIETQHAANDHITPKKTRKRKVCISEWKRNNKKKLKTEGKRYIGHRG
jgi:hypothetical protein